MLNKIVDHNEKNYLNINRKQNLYFIIYLLTKYLFYTELLIKTSKQIIQGYVS